MAMSNSLHIEIKEICSSGSFADVYKGKVHRGSSIEDVAIKILKEKWLQNDDQLRRFWDEAQIVMQLNHQNITQVQGILEIANRPAILMEFVNGLDLKKIIEHPALSFSPKAAFEIAGVVAKTLNDVYGQSTNQLGHSLAVLHRDIKPSNIMLNRNGLVRVLDFGASQFNDDQRLAQTALHEPGSQKYSPPDRRLGNRGNHTGDVFALGLVLIELLQNQLLPVPPLDPTEYNRLLTHCIQNLDFGLPNEEWTNSAKDTLFRMCSFDPERRLNAEQALHMLTPYAKQARGESTTDLIAQQFSRTPIHYATGELTGQRLHLHLLTSLSDPQSEDPVQPTEQNTSSPTKDSSPTSVFWKQFTISAATIFFSLHLLSFAVLSLFGSTAQNGDSSGTDLSLSVSKTNIAVLKILNEAEKTLLKLPRSRKSGTLNLAKGTYIVQIQHSKHSETETFTFDLQENAELLCENKEKNRCFLDGSSLQ